MDEHNGAVAYSQDEPGLTDSANAGMGLLSLRFSDPDLERSFGHGYFHKSLRQVRISLWVGLSLYAVFGLLDPYIIADAVRTAWGIRYGIVCPFILIVLALSYLPLFERIMQSAVAITGLIASLGILAMIVAAAPPGSYYYYAGLLLACSFINTFMRLRFAPAAAVTWTIVILYEVIAFDRTPPAIFVNNSFFVITVNFVTSYACYFMERSARRDFLHTRTIEAQARQLNVALQNVDLARREAESRSRLDPLTGMFNRRYFFEMLTLELDGARHGTGPAALMMLDLDHFKQINDTHGHGVGDQVLCTIAGEIVASLRRADVACRYGGEEFAVLLSDSDRDSAAEVANRLRENVEAADVQTSAGALKVTISIGVALFRPGQTVPPDRLLEQADKALYDAKKAGRNRVRVRQPAGEASGEGGSTR